MNRKQSNWRCEVNLNSCQFCSLCSSNEQFLTLPSSPTRPPAVRPPKAIQPPPTTTTIETICTNTDKATTSLSNNKTTVFSISHDNIITTDSHNRHTTTTIATTTNNKIIINKNTTDDKTIATYLLGVFFARYCTMYKCCTWVIILNPCLLNSSEEFILSQVLKLLSTSCCHWNLISLSSL